MPLTQDYVAGILGAFLVTCLVAYLDVSDAASLKRSGNSEDFSNPEDGLARELRDLPAKGSKNAGPGSQGVPPASNPVGYDDATMLMIKRYVDQMKNRPIHEAPPAKKSTYAPNMYPLFGSYGKRVQENPNYGYDTRIMDMVRDLVQRTEDEAHRESQIEHLAELSHKAADSSGEINDKKEGSEESQESKELDEVAIPKATGQEDRAARVSAYEDKADARTLEEMREPPVPKKRTRH